MLTERGFRILSFLILNVLLNLQNKLDFINDTVFKSTVKYRNHPSTIKIGSVYKKQRESLFIFSHVDKEQILKEILNLDSTKVIQHASISKTIIKENADTFQIFIFQFLFILSVLPNFSRGSNRQI